MRAAPADETAGRPRCSGTSTVTASFHPVTCRTTACRPSLRTTTTCARLSNWTRRPTIVWARRFRCCPASAPRARVCRAVRGVVNASFCHANPLGSRFNGPIAVPVRVVRRATSQAEVAFHNRAARRRWMFDDSSPMTTTSPTSRRRSRPSRRPRRHEAWLDPFSYVESRRWPNACSLRVHWAWCIRACVTPAARASAASGRPSSATSARQGLRFTWNGAVRRHARTVERFQFGSADVEPQRLAENC